MGVTWRVGVDIGGTFTDIVLLGSDGTIHTRKISSTVDNYARAIVQGLAELFAETGVTGAAIEEIRHGTTVASNAILEHKGARTGLITTRGFRDVLEIRTLRMPRLYDIAWEKPAPLVERHLRRVVEERVDAEGRIERPLDPAEAERVVEGLLAEGVEAIAICLLHAYANPAHEQVIADIVRRRAPDLPLSVSSEVLPEIKEYERSSTTVINAYVMPIVARYLRALHGGLDRAGVPAPLLLMQSNGGLMAAEAAAAKPMHIVESGPAAGVVGAQALARAKGLPDVITFDMGGTTAKAAMIEGGEPMRTTEYEVGAGINLSSRLVKGGGHAVKMPFIDVSEIGAGGGSIVRLDAGGAIRVGPDSAGSSPGPACYDLGGDLPTFTDAAVVLGYLNPVAIAGGSVRLNAARAVEALSRHIATPANLPVPEAAAGVYAIAAATMTRAVKAVSTYRGRDPREFTLFAFGGNGPLVAVQVAQLLEMRKVVVPPSPGVFSALGLLYSQTRREVLQTVYRPLALLNAEGVQARLDGLRRSVAAALADEGCPAEMMRFQAEADLHYVGQAYELTVPLAGSDLAAAEAAFHAEHERTYGHASPSDAVELVNLRLIGTRADTLNRRVITPDLSAPTGPAVFRRVRFPAGSLDTPVVDRGALLAGRRPGPLIVEEYDSTTVVPPGWGAELDAHANIVITPED